MEREAAATLVDVARRAGVSLATASRVVNGSSRAVGAGLRERVLQAADELGYIPNAHAQALASASTSTVGLIVHDVGDPYFSAIASGVLEVATEHGLLVMICNAYRDPSRELAYVSTLRAQRVQAVLLAASGFEDPAYAERMGAELRSFTALDGRVACISRHNLAVDTILPDNRGGAGAMGRALIELGHREIGLVTGPAILTTVRDRVEGFSAALHQAGVTLPPHRVVDGGFTREQAYCAVGTLLDRAPEVTAVFALNDLMATGVLAGLRERGVRVPDDVSVAGFDDIQMVRDLTPALSTVRVPMEELGAQAMRLALAPRHQEPTVHTLPTEVVLRDSTAAREG